MQRPHAERGDEQLRPPHHPGPHRVEVHVAGQLPVVRCRLDQDGLEPALVGAALVAAVGAVREPPLLVTTWGGQPQGLPLRKSPRREVAPEGAQGPGIDPPKSQANYTGHSGEPCYNDSAAGRKGLPRTGLPTGQPGSSRGSRLARRLASRVGRQPRASTKPTALSVLRASEELWSPGGTPSVRSLSSFPLRQVHFRGRDCVLSGGPGHAGHRRDQQGASLFRPGDPTSLWTGSGATSQPSRCKELRVWLIRRCVP